MRKVHRSYVQLSSGIFVLLPLELPSELIPSVPTAIQFGWNVSNELNDTVDQGCVLDWGEQTIYENNKILRMLGLAAGHFDEESYPDYLNENWWKK